MANGKRGVMVPHHLSARIWATAALAATLLPAGERLGWWLPLHLALIGAATQLIVGGQIMFSSTLGMAPEPSGRAIRAQLVLLNVGAASIVAGRVWSVDVLLALGALSLLTGVTWGAVTADNCWKKGLGSRFAVTRTFYRLAVLSFINGALMGAAMALGFLNNSYAEHKAAHLAFNLMGFAGLTVLGTAVTFLPMLLRVRAPATRSLKVVPWLVAGGILCVGVGLSFSRPLVSAAGAVLILSGFIPFVSLVRKMLEMPRRRRIPVSALHILCGLAWFLVTLVAQVYVLGTGNLIDLRDLWVVGLALGFVIQAILGAWAFLIPMTRPAEGELRRRELVVFELGARTQVVAYNGGLIAMLGGYLGWFPDPVSLIGLIVTLLAAASALLKTWVFVPLARLDFVADLSERWWVPVDDRSKPGTPDPQARR
jgi:nitrite reductase (NO-forming)